MDCQAPAGRPAQGLACQLRLPLAAPALGRPQAEESRKRVLRIALIFLFKEAYFYASLLQVTSRCAIRGKNPKIGGFSAQNLLECLFSGEYGLLGPREKFTTLWS